MIELYLIRHGLAGEFGTYTNDDERPLTEDGKKKTCLVAKRLMDLGLQFDLILTSPLTRARQTAGILVEIGLNTQCQEANYLVAGTITPWLDWLTAWTPGNQEYLALVGGVAEWRYELPSSPTLLPKDEGEGKLQNS